MKIVVALMMKRLQVDSSGPIVYKKRTTNDLKTQTRQECNEMQQSFHIHYPITSA